MKKKTITAAVVGAVAVLRAPGASGLVTARTVSHNATVAPGQRVECGFQASRPSGNTATPTSFSYMGS